MSASDIALWVVVAAVAFMFGQGRLTISGARRALWTIGDEQYGNDGAEAVLLAYRRWLLTFMVRSYSLEELHTLAFDIGVSWDGIGGNTIQERARELILHCENHGMIGVLLESFNAYRR